ncbi:DNA replication checkpoint protein tel2 [Drechslerella dactyloides]|uniref:DNA replication checkpoint protein tel2 n=1 Tax=Drechslerella dactyloides TaxID=74499 RepID=A0AAD6J244_DREDA|nr:DNA replication checkpoint protein tel2 [Drechslerella dactyloides]
MYAFESVFMFIEYSRRIHGLLQLAGFGVAINCPRSTCNSQNANPGHRTSMDDFLTPIHITSLRTSTADDSALDLKLSSTTLIRPVDEPPVTASSSSRAPTSLEDALEILRSQPSLAELSAVLRYISPRSARNGAENSGRNPGSNDAGFDIAAVSPLASRIINAVIVDVVPSFWSILTSSPAQKSERSRLLRCLRSVSGVGGLVERLKVLLKQAASLSSERPRNVTLAKVDVAGAGQRYGLLVQVGDLMDVLGCLLQGDKFISEIWKCLGPGKDGAVAAAEVRKREMAWKEFVGLIAGGRVLSIAAEADVVVSGAGQTVEKRQSSWVGDGKMYTSWLRENITKMVAETAMEDSATWGAIASVLAKAFGLGYNESLIDPVFCSRVSTVTEDAFRRIRLLLSHLKEHEKRSYINTLLKLLSQTHLPIYAEEEPSYTKRIALVAQVIHEICIVDDGLQKGYQDMLLDWILVDGGPGAAEPIGIRRAVISAVKASSEATNVFRECLESQIQTFGESLWIRHAPIVHQEVNVQCLLLCAGLVHRIPPSYLKLAARSSPFMNGISNHLASTNLRVRFLGMIVGETVSSLVDQGGKQLKFTDSLDASEDEAAKWRGLVKVDDTLPGFEIFQDGSLSSTKSSKPPKRKSPVKPKAVVDITPTTTLTPSNRIEELDSDSGDDDLIPYPKPDSDPEDSDDDATLVNRKKPTPPVYIRDLLYMLHDHESYDKQHLALQHAAVLIRRKATHGSELSAHAVELLNTLVGQQDKFDMEDFDTLRLKAVVAIVVTLPSTAGPWIAQRIFEGDYSLAQRCVMLSAIGVAATELAGDPLPDDSPLLQFQLSQSDKDKAAFPSRRLPPQLHRIYAVTPVDALSTQLKNTMLQPMAARAAHELAPAADLLNVRTTRTFSTRMAVEAARKPPAANRLAQVVSAAFFAPLTGHWWVFLHDHGSSSPRLQPHLLSLYLKTLTVLLHATGPNAVAVSSLVDGLWDILLSLRVAPIALENSSVLDAILVGLLTVFEVAGGGDSDAQRRRLAEERGKELVETQEWVGKVFDGSEGGEGGGEGRRALAAAVLLRCREVVERYERLLMGDLIG